MEILLMRPFFSRTTINTFRLFRHPSIVPKPTPTLRQLFSSSTHIMFHSNNATATSVEPQDRLVDGHGNPLPLPAPPSAEEAQKLDLSSGQCTAKLDHLGPLVVNKDGTLSQIANWEQMSEIERSNTLRILGKRNQLRREALSAEEGEGVGSREGR